MKGHPNEKIAPKGKRKPRRNKPRTIGTNVGQMIREAQAEQAKHKPNRKAADAMRRMAGGK